MKKLLTGLSAATFAAVTLLASGAMADGHLEKAIKARQAQMALYSFNLGQLGAIAKGQADYDAKVAAAAAANLLAVAKIDGAAMWPQGSDDEAMPGKTRALKKAWTTYPAVVENQKQLLEALEAMNAAAGKDLESLQGAMGGVGKACGACHKAFRAEKS
ncbi:MAG: c-type cytochrome [Hyphomicrobiales bacterium]